LDVPLLGSRAMLNSATLNSARSIVRDYVKLEKDEKVLIVTDWTRLSVADVLSYAVIEVNESLTTRRELSMSMIAEREYGKEEPPKCVAAAMKVADVVLIPTKTSLTFTEAVREARSNARIGSMPGVIEQMMIDGGLRADPSDIRDLTEKVAKVLESAEEYVVTSRNGTNISFSRGERQVFRDDGDLSGKGKVGNLPAGEACMPIIENSAKGRLVIDRLGKIVTNGVELKVEDGRIVEVIGPDARRFKGLLDSARGAGYSTPNIVAEFGIGTNSAAKYVEVEMEAEKMYGTVHFGIGGNATIPGGQSAIPFHHDGMIFDAKLELGGKLFLDGRKFYF